MGHDQKQSAGTNSKELKRGAGTGKKRDDPVRLSELVRNGTRAIVFETDIVATPGPAFVGGATYCSSVAMGCDLRSRFSFGFSEKRRHNFCPFSETNLDGGRSLHLPSDAIVREHVPRPETGGNVTIGTGFSRVHEFRRFARTRPGKRKSCFRYRICPETGRNYSVSAAKNFPGQVDKVSNK